MLAMAQVACSATGRWGEQHSLTNGATTPASTALKGLLGRPGHDVSQRPRGFELHFVAEERGLSVK